MSSLRARIGDRAGAASVGLLALIAYLPALASSPGRMPADTKLFLYTDPGALVADARWSYDPRLYGGWVTHQTVSYLWPSGPWFWLFDRLDVTDWVAHRLWIGSLFVLAGVGALWLARQLGLDRRAALVAAVAYQCTPYLLPYVSRTSVMLLPWVGLPWLVGLARRAVHRGGWRDPALFALVVVTVGAVNATATLMVAVGPVLWLVHEATNRVSVRHVLTAGARIGLLAAGACAWWVGAVAVQGRYGADVLTYSESYSAVSSTASAAEVLRGQGYWLGYVQTPVPTTSMTAVYQTSPLLVGLGFALILLALAGLVLVPWQHARFGAWCVLAGVVLASAAHSTGSPSLLARLLADHSTNSIVLGLRSSTRAIPLVALGLGLGLGALAQAGAVRLRAPGLVPLLAIVLTLANLPALWRFDLVDPFNDRQDPIPAAWVDTARTLDETPTGGRTLQIPGAEFGAHTWGVTSDPLLAGLSRRPLLTRDLLPLGSAGLMDTFFALDDRIQNGVFEPASLAPVARLLGADRVVVPLDWDVARYDTYPPDRLADALVGAPGLRLLSRDDTAATFAVDDPEPVMRAAAGETLFVGDGAGLVDAAAAGLVDGHGLVLAAPSLDEARLVEAARAASAVIMTDTNRKRARHWRTSQDVLGETEDLASTSFSGPGDFRLPVYPDQSEGAVTYTHQQGSVTASVSAYGDPLAYRPEDRAAHAIDGDAGTAWRVARGADPVAQWLRLDFASPADLATIHLVQPSGARSITAVTLTSVNGTAHVTLTDRAQDVATTLGISPWLELRIDAIDTGQVSADAMPNGVGFAEVTTGAPGAPLVGDEVVVLPSLLDSVAGELDPDVPFAVVLTRERADRASRERTDPEARIVRAFSLPGAGLMDLEVAAHGAGAAVDPGCRDDLLRVDGVGVALRVHGAKDGDGEALSVERCGSTEPLALAAGPHRVETSAVDELAIDRVVLRSGTWPRSSSDSAAPEVRVPVTVTAQSRTHRAATIGPCPQGCWFVLGEGRNEGWDATIDGTAAGAPTFVDGGMNGWWLAPSANPRRISMTWTPQRTTNVALLVTFVTVLACLVLLCLVLFRQGRRAPVDVDGGPGELTLVNAGARRAPLGLVAGAGILALVVISPLYALLAVGCLLVLARPLWLGAVPLAVMSFVGAGYVARLVLSDAQPSFGWVGPVEWAHRPTLFAVLMVAAACRACPANLPPP